MPALRCPYCHDDVAPDQRACPRPACGAVYHLGCWRECTTTYGGCAVYGCVPPPPKPPRSLFLGSTGESLLFPTFVLIRYRRADPGPGAVVLTWLALFGALFLLGTNVATTFPLPQPLEPGAESSYVVRLLLPVWVGTLAYVTTNVTLAGAITGWLERRS